MSWQFGRIDLTATTYVTDLSWQYLDPVPVSEVQRVYREYCLHKHFQSVMPMLAGRLTASDTEIIGYRDQSRLVAWSMYRIWDRDNVLSDHFAWDYRDPRLRLGIRSVQNECAIYRERGFRWMYFESVEPYMLDLQGFEILGGMK
jgi:hypothetical protein